MTTTTTTMKSKQIIFVSGKGGVGKSLLAAGIARELAASGRRVLLAEIGETSYYQDFWGLSSVGHDPIKHPLGFDLALWSGESCLREYVLFYLKMERLYSLFFENKVMRALINVAPGLSEIAILGKITSGIRKVGPPMPYDTVVVDMYATGHALALLLAPRGMMEAIKFGPMGHHSREMEAVIKNEKLCSYVVATLLEELPVTETLEFCDTLKKELGVHCEIVANKVIELPAKDSELKQIEGEGSKSLAEFARHLRGVSERQEKFRAQLHEVRKKLVEVPLIFSADPDTLVEKAGEALRNL